MVSDTIVHHNFNRKETQNNACNIISSVFTMKIEKTRRIKIQNKNEREENYLIAI
jgi:hypothetical protein